MTRFEVFSVVANSATAIAALVGAIAAWRALNTWRSQLIGQTNYDLAKRLLTKVYDLRNSINSIRQVVTFENQLAVWEVFEKLTSQLDVELLEAKVIWGDELIDAKKQLKGCVSALRIARRKSRDSERHGVSDEMKENLRTQYEPILDATGEDDEYSKQLSAAVEAFEKKLTRHLHA